MQVKLYLAPGRQGPWPDEWGSVSPEEGGISKETELLGLGRQGLAGTGLSGMEQGKIAANSECRHTCPPPVR